MSEIAADYNVEGMSDAELTRREREIARKYMQGISIPMVLWPILNLSCWLALWPLVLTGIMPLWLAFPIALVNITLAYLPSHEAQHDIYARPGDKLRWLNEAIGHLSLIPLAYGYRILRLTHLEHHKNTNDPVLDPDHVFNHGGNLWQTIWLSIQSYQPGSKARVPAMATACKGLAQMRPSAPILSKSALSSPIWLFYSPAPIMVWRWRRCFYGGCR